MVEKDGVRFLSINSDSQCESQTLKLAGEVYARFVALKNSELPHAAKTEAAQMMEWNLLERFVLPRNVCIQSSFDLSFE